MPIFSSLRRMDVRAFTAVLLTVMKAALTVIIFLTARDLRHMGLLFNLSFAVTYVASATILFPTFYRARPVAGLIGNVDRLEGVAGGATGRSNARTPWLGSLWSRASVVRIALKEWRMLPRSGHPSRIFR